MYSKGANDFLLVSLSLYKSFSIINSTGADFQDINKEDRTLTIAYI